MIGKYLATAMLGTAIIGGAAFAQTAAAPATSISADRAAGAAIKAADELKGTWRSSKLVGLAVYNEANERLGDINEILVDKSGKINAVILGVGGFLGVGEQNVAVSFDQLKWIDEPVKTASNTPVAPIGGPASTVGSSASNNVNARPNTIVAHDVWYPDHAVFSGTKDQLKALPAFKYSDYNK